MTNGLLPIEEKRIHFNRCKDRNQKGAEDVGCVGWTLNPNQIRASTTEAGEKRTLGV